MRTPWRPRTLRSIPPPAWKVRTERDCLLWDCAAPGTTPHSYCNAIKKTLINENSLRLYLHWFLRGRLSFWGEVSATLKLGRVFVHQYRAQKRGSVSPGADSLWFLHRHCYGHCDQHRGPHHHRADCLSRIKSGKWENTHCYWDRTFCLPGGRSGRFHRCSLLHYIYFAAIQDSGLHHLSHRHHCGKCARGTASHSNGKPTLEFTRCHCSSSVITAINHS